jgi:hypothetical protein
LVSRVFGVPAGYVLQVRVPSINRVVAARGLYWIVMLVRGVRRMPSAAHSGAV